MKKQFLTVVAVLFAAVAFAQDQVEIGRVGDVNLVRFKTPQGTDESYARQNIRPEQVNNGRIVFINSENDRPIISNKGFDLSNVTLSTADPLFATIGATFTDYDDFYTTYGVLVLGKTKPSGPGATSFTELIGTIADNQVSETAVTQFINKTESGNRKGYVVLPSDFSFTTTNLSPYENYIIEIKEAFDLGDAVVNLPTNSKLYFTGGALSNFAELNGDKSIIDVVGDYQIFYYDRTTQKIDGEWLHNEWSVKWFGAVADGDVITGTYDSETDTFTANPNTTTVRKVDIDLEFSGTDNYDSFQKTFDTAYFTNVKNTFCPIGYYRLAQPLNIGWSGYSSITFSGEREYKLGDITEYKPAQGTYLLIDHFNYGINVNGGYSSELKNMTIFGHNAMTGRRFTTMLQNRVDGINFYPETLGDWNSNYAKDMLSTRDYGIGKYDPYVGVATDAFKNHSTIDGAYRKYTLPTPPVGVTFTDANNSTRFKMENVTVEGFSVGVGIEVGNFSDNADFYNFFNVHIKSGIYGISNGSNQSRNTGFTDCSFGQLYAAFTDDRVGGELTSNGVSYYGIANNCTFDAVYQIVDILNSTSTFIFQNAYCENSYRLGNWNSYIDATKRAAIIFKESQLRFIMDVDNPLGIPTSTFTGNNIILENSSISNTNGLIMPLISRNIKIDNSSVDVSSFYYSGLVSDEIDNTLVTSTNKTMDIDWSINDNYKATDQIYIDYNGQKKYLPEDVIYGDTNLIADTGSMTFDSETRKLKLYYFAGLKDPKVGDVIGSKQGLNSYSVITKLGSDGGGNFIESYVINGFRKVDDGDGTYSYVLINDMTIGQYDVIYKSIKWFESPVRILDYTNGISDSELAVEEWNDNLTVGKKLLLGFEDTIDLDNNFFSSIISVDESNLTVTVNNPIKYLKSGNLYAYRTDYARDYWEKLPSIWNEIPEQITDPILAAEPIAYYEPSGISSSGSDGDTVTGWVDSIGELDATVTGNVTLNIGSVEQVEFDGGYLSIENDTSIDFDNNTDEYSFVLKLGNVGSHSGWIFSKNNSDDFQYALRIDGTSNIVAFAGGNPTPISATSETLPVLNSTVFIMVVRTDGFDLYQDGNKIINNASVGSAQGTGNGIQLGAKSGIEQADTSIERFAIYNKALSSSEITAINNQYKEN